MTGDSGARCESIGSLMERLAQVESMLESVTAGDVGEARDLLMTLAAALREAQQALQKSVCEYGVLVEKSNDAMYLLYGSRFEVINPKFTELLGVTQEEARSPEFDFMCLVAPESRALVEERGRRLAAGEELCPHYEFWAQAKDGRKLLVEASVSYVPYRGDVATLGALRDVTERKRTEWQLREVERRFHTLLDNVELVAVGLDENGKVEYANPYLLELTGYALEEVLGADWFQTFMPPRDRPEISIVFTGILESLLHLHDENPIVTRAGEERWIAWNNTVLLDVHGKPIGTMSIGEDITERRRVEEALQRSESQYRTTLDSMADGIHVVDADLRLILMNNVYRKWIEDLGLETDVIGKGLFEVFPFLLEKAREEYRRVFESGEPLVTKERTDMGGGTLVTEARKIPVFEGEKVIRVITVVRDITAQEQLQEELNQRGEQMASLYRMAIDVTSQLDLEHLLQSLVRRTTEILGGSSGGFYLYRPSQDDLRLVVTYSMDPIWMGTVLKRGEGLSGKVLESGQVMSVEDYRTWEGRAACFDGGGFGAVIGLPVMWGERLVGVVNVVREAGATFDDEDIRLMTLFVSHIGGAIETAWLFAEAKRRVQEMEALQRTSLQLTSSLDLATVLDSITESALKLVGARDCHIYLYDDASETFTFGTALWDNGRRAPAVTAPRRDGLTATVARGGQPVVINDATCHPLYAGYDAQKWGVQAIAGFPLKRAGRVLGVLTIAFVEPHVFDDHELRVVGLLADQAAVAIANARLYETAHQRLIEWQKAEDERRRLEAQLRQSQKMEAMGLLAGGMAHDFNNLLTVIMGNAELCLLQAAPGQPFHKELSVIQKVAHRGAELTQQLLAFSRRQELVPQVLDLNELVRGFVGILERLLGEKIELRLELLPSLQPAMADGGAVEQVLMNLALNASDAMPDGGVLRIATEQVTADEIFCRAHPEAKPGEYARMTVADSGEGMDEATLQHLFEPFFTTKDVGKGTGLGLSVVYGIVRQHGGWIEVDSEVGGGTRVKVYLPGGE